MTTPKLQMPELVVGQAGKELTHNQALAVLDQLAQAVVVDKDLTVPPGSPANGSMYIVATGATDAWAGQDGKLAYWLTTVAAWTFITPADGWSAWVTDEAVRYERKAGTWAVVSTGGTSLPVVRYITGNETLGLSNINTFGVNSTVSNYASTIPAQATVAWTADAELHFLPSNTGDITVTAAAGVSLNGVVAGSLTLSTQNGAATLKRTGADSWWLGGVIGTAAEQRVALGLGTAAVANLTTSSVDTTAGRALKTGDGGLLGAAIATASLDTSIAGGYCHFTERAVGSGGSPPLGLDDTWEVLNIAGTNANRALQIGGAIASTRFALRARSGGVNSQWAEAWTSSGTNAVTVDTGSLGYGTGSGGTVTQATSKATGVTLNKPSGQITTASDALAANTAASFTLTNNKIAANDVPKVVIKSGATAGAYLLQVDAVAAGSCRISIRNVTAGSLSEALVLQFNIEKGAIA